MLEVIIGPTLKTGLEATLFVIVAVVILFIGIFRLDSIFQRPRPSEELHPPRKRRMRVIVENADDTDPESIASAHKR